jgi:hypothetical protein
VAVYDCQPAFSARVDAVGGVSYMQQQASIGLPLINGSENTQWKGDE